MRKCLYFVAAVVLGMLLVSESALLASPAYPGAIKYTQPDGSTITIYLHGDEFYNWVTDTDGNELVLDDDGYYRQAAEKMSMAQRSQASMSSPMRGPIKASSSATGSNHYLVILVNFSDKKFTSSTANADFTDKLNKADYSSNGATGSVFDYFNYNSMGKFTPVFDVFGPVDISISATSFNDYDNQMGSFILAACQAADKAGLDFSQYDLDSNGRVDNVFFYFAGYNQAEGAKNTIWPHRWNFSSACYYDNNVSTYTSYKFDGKYIYDYACSSELTGTSGSSVCGIGTFCHEFSHVLGLQDMYDTDYETNGESVGLYSFSLMSSGNYNNNGNTPPLYNAFERKSVGWISSLTEWNTEGSKTIAPLKDGNMGYTMQTGTSGEYFLFENRVKTGWDAYIPASGMLIYHIDQSSTYSNRWSNNDVNAYSAHPCMHLHYSKYKYASSCSFPGTYSVTSYTDESSPDPFVSWSGASMGYGLYDIAVDKSNNVTLTLTKKESYFVSGTVTNAYKELVSGVTVTLKASTKASLPEKGSGLQLIAPYLVDEAFSPVSVTTGSDGSYKFDMTEASNGSYILTFVKDGYTTKTINFNYSGEGKSINTVLTKFLPLDESQQITKFDPNTESIMAYGYDGSSSYSKMYLAVKLSASELQSYVGQKLGKIAFLTYAEGSVSVGELGVCVFWGGEMKLQKKLDSYELNEYNLVDLSDKNLVIPADTDVYVGYYYLNSTNISCMLVDKTTTNNGAFYVSTSGTQADLANNDMSSYGALFVACSFMDAGSVNPQDVTCNFIKKESSYKSNKTYILSMESTSASSVKWYVDDDEPITIKGYSYIWHPSEGTHNIRAVLTFSDGSKETVYQEINVTKNPRFK